MQKNITKSCSTRKRFLFWPFLSSNSFRECEQINETYHPAYKRLIGTPQIAREIIADLKQKINRETMWIHSDGSSHIGTTGAGSVIVDTRKRIIIQYMFLTDGFINISFWDNGSVIRTISYTKICTRYKRQSWHGKWQQWSYNWPRYSDI